MAGRGCQKRTEGREEERAFVAFLSFPLKDEAGRVKDEAVKNEGNSEICFDPCVGGPLMRCKIACEKKW